MAHALTKTEATELQQLESTIEAGLHTFVEVGMALSRVRDARLYRETHKDFDAYCRERWGWSKRRSNQLIGAASIVETMKEEVGTIVPANEGQARELIPVPAEKRGEVMQEAAKLSAPKPPSAQDVKKAAAPYVPMAERLERAEKRAAAKAKKESKADALRAQREEQYEASRQPPKSEAELETPEPQVESGSTGLLPEPRRDEVASAPKPPVEAEEGGHTDAVVGGSVAPANTRLPGWLLVSLTIADQKPSEFVPLSNEQAESLTESECAKLDTVWLAIKQAVARSRAVRAQQPETAGVAA